MLLKKDLRPSMVYIYGYEQPVISVILSRTCVYSGQWLKNKFGKFLKKGFLQIAYVAPEFCT